MIGPLDISTSALVAQRVRLEAIAGNIANMSTVRNENGELEPYQSRFVVMESDESLATPSGAMGVRVAAVEKRQVDPDYRWEPDNPLSIKDGPRKGYVAYPHVNMMHEFVDALHATRAYEANVGVIETTKSMGQQTLRILA